MRRIAADRRLFGIVLPPFRDSAFDRADGARDVAVQPDRRAAPRPRVQTVHVLSHEREPGYQPPELHERAMPRVRQSAHDQIQSRTRNIARRVRIPLEPLRSSQYPHPGTSTRVRS